MAFLPLAGLPPYVLLAASHPLANRSSVSLSEFRDEPFVLLDLPLSRQHFLSFFERENLIPNIIAETSNPATLRSYVGMGLGYSLLTARPLSTMAENDRPLSYVRLEGGYRSVVIGLATLKGLQSPRVVEVFKSYCQEIVSSNHIPGMLALPEG